MFDTLMIGTSGLLGHAKGLRVVGNNLANVNTPGFKGSQLQFANLFEQGGGVLQQQGSGVGTGLDSLGSRVNFQAGIDQATGNALDLSISGNGFYTVKRDGQLLYTRAGDFQFNADGVLVNGSGDHVQGLSADGQLVDVKIGTLATNSAKATTTIKFAGNLTSTVAVPPVDASISSVSFFDANGISHAVSLSFHDNGGGSYTVTASHVGGAVIGTGTLKFIGGLPDPANSILTFPYSTTGVAQQNIKLDFSEQVTSLVSSTDLAFSSQDGYAAGVRTAQTIGADGVLTVHYSNGQTATGTRLALAGVESDSDLVQGSGSAFTLKQDAQVRYGYASTGTFGSLVSGHREGSNVDLAEEFSNLILMQRGYQASSHVISTANDMIQELFDMKGHR